MFAAVSSATVLGAHGQPVTVEVHVSTGLPAFAIVGLPDEACRESRDRVRAALLSSSLPWPQKRITVNLAPSMQRKGGSSLDLAIALGVLVASGELPQAALAEFGFVGELGLDGTVRRLPGIVPLVGALRELTAVVPRGCEAEANAVTPAWRSARDLAELVAVLRKQLPWPDPPAIACRVPVASRGDMSEVRGQGLARLAVELAAAGGHHLLLVGSPGCGKTMLAERLSGLLPDLDQAEALVATMTHSAAGVTLPPSGLVTRPPFRAPHHTASLVSMVGGGTAAMRPGEVSLASGGVLFLDEMSEFPVSVLDGLRQPLEEGVVRVTRARASVEFPAQFLLVGATNPCPCGLGAAPGACRCEGAVRQRFLRRLSGPLLDRFDLRIHVTAVGSDDLLSSEPAESSASIAQRVQAVRTLALQRGVPSNARLSSSDLDRWATLSPNALAMVRHAIEIGRLSGRGVQRIRRVARTIDDRMGVQGALSEQAVASALAMRIDVAPLVSAA